MSPPIPESTLVLGIKTFNRHDVSCGLHKSSPVSVVAHAPMNARPKIPVSDDFFMIPSFDYATLRAMPNQRHSRAKTVSQYPIGASGALRSTQQIVPFGCAFGLHLCSETRCDMLLHSANCGKSTTSLERSNRAQLQSMVMSWIDHQLVSGAVTAPV